MFNVDNAVTQVFICWYARPMAQQFRNARQTQSPTISQMRPYVYAYDVTVTVCECGIFYVTKHSTAQFSLRLYGIINIHTT